MREAREAVRKWLEEAVEIRYSLELSAYDDLLYPQQIVEQLTKVRSALDRIEQLLTKSLRAKASLSRSHRQAKDVLQQKWDEHVTNVSAIKRPVLTQEFVTGREKFAEANLATLEWQRAERKVLETLSFAEESVDVIRQLHRGLDGIRQDLLAQVRVMQVESQLER